ncbi:MAG: hypothetical protein A2293_06820 [Elusimicrobia bacterium RIFOXYB2_FULL_49_7]|nr:MAG: hypothetical protein A2293_06820 [Elusimicrobia bacterium RIFOXYB2_FULL_49_7]
MNSTQSPGNNIVRLMIILAAWLCFLPVPIIFHSFHAGSISILLVLIFGLHGAWQLSRKTAGRWTYISVIIISVGFNLLGSIIFDKGEIIPLFTRVSHALGPMLIILLFIKDYSMLRFAVMTVMSMLFVSTFFAVAIDLIGDPFYSIKFYLISVSEHDILDQESFFSYASGLRGSVYMFGYDLIVLFGILAGFLYNRQLSQAGNRRIQYILVAVGMAAVFFTMQINGERMPVLISAAILCLALVTQKGDNAIAKIMAVLFIGTTLVVLGGALLNSDITTGAFGRLRSTSVESNDLRMELIDIALYSLKNDPFSPLDTYESLAPTYLGNPLPPHVHFLTVLIKYGIGVLPVIIFIIYRLIRSSIFQIKYMSDQTSWMIYYALLGFLLNGLAHNPGPWWETPSGVFILALWGKSMDLFNAEKCDNMPDARNACA